MNDRWYCPHCGAQVGPDVERCTQCGRSIPGSAPSIAPRGEHEPATEGPALEAEGTLGPYRLVRQLGQGGFAEVWEAENRDSGRRIAVKVLTELRADSSEALERFRREGRLTAAISHPRCVYVFGADEVEGYAVIAMELMRGGTLADRLEGGPLPAETAVDHVLDILDGLEAGQRVGIIHRDIKPSNCFLDESGRAKIGDFGISKSLEAESSLTATGSFLGTPHYSSPEQVSGEPLDFRSDLYSVGAMLYELLTGHVPFRGTSASQVLAQVLTKEPTQFAQHGIDVPRGLQRVVLRLLAKEKDKRHPSYQALRAALTPYSTHSLGAAALFKRFGAIAVDFVIFWPIGMFVGFNAMSRGGLPQMWAMVGIIAVQLAYFGLLEGRFGFTLGKWLFKLRVAAATAEPAGFRRSILRAVVFLGVYNLQGIVVQVLLVLGVDPLAWMPYSGLGILASIGILVATMRKKNGYAGLHELSSGTRTLDVARERRVAQPTAKAALDYRPVLGGHRFGPYRTLGTVWRTEHEAFMVVRDDELDRDVWIHQFAHAEHGPPSERLHTRREGTLPWLQRGRDDKMHWDAYGAPRGIAFVHWVGEHGRLDWAKLRGPAASLARELSQRLESDGSAGPLTLDHIWVDDAGHTILLDFPIEPENVSGRVAEVTTANGLDFVGDAMALGLTGAVLAPAEVPRVPLPQHVRAIVGRLCGEGDPFASTEELADELRLARHRPAEVTQLRRLGSMAAPVALPTFFALFLVVFPLMFAAVPQWFVDLAFDLPVYQRQLDSAATAVETGSTLDSVTARTVEAIRIVLADASVQTQQSPEMGRSITRGMPEEAHAMVEEAARLYPDPTVEQVADARAWIDEHVTLLNPGDLGGSTAEGVDVGLMMLGFLALPGLLLAFAFRGPVFLHASGIAVQQTNGTPARRWRCALRSLVAWSPLMLFAFVAYPQDAFVVQVLLITIVLAGLAWSVKRPTRGPADLIAGTVLVPK